LADHHRLHGPETDPAGDSGYPADHPARKGFFTDTSICIGCKACEVACKQWNGLPDDGFNLLGMSYDNTGALGASTWRHVAFIEQPAPPPAPVELGMPGMGPPGAEGQVVPLHAGDLAGLAADARRGVDQLRDALLALCAGAGHGAVVAGDRLNAQRRPAHAFSSLTRKPLNSGV